MNESSNLSLSRTVLAHAATVLVTLALVLVFSGGRLGGRLLPAQISSRPREVQTPAPPRPATEQPASRPQATADPQTPPPPDDVLKGARSRRAESISKSMLRRTRAW